MRYATRSLVTTFLALAFVGLFAVGCDQADPTTPVADGIVLTPQADEYDEGVIHHVSMGGADLCEALGLPTGCDANFSLAANMFSDGSVKGQWQDTFGGGEGVHVSVDCLNVVGNGAVIGGVITKGTAGGADVSGLRALTAVVDNGTAKGDTPDQLSFSFFPTGASCTDLVPFGFPLFDLTNGQVTVR